MNYWERWIGDWKRKTAHLSAEERGIYAELLDHQYATEAALPENLDACCRIAGASTKDERAGVEKIIAEFFPQGMNPRAAEEIEKRRAFIAKKSQAARYRWDNEERPAHKGNGEDCDPLAFDKFWQAYPRKTAKGAAERAWAKIKPADHAAIHAALDSQRPHWKDPKFIPHPATWLNGKRWLDETQAPAVDPFNPGPGRAVM